MWQDLRYAVRFLGRSPGFTAVALAALAQEPALVMELVMRTRTEPAGAIAAARKQLAALDREAATDISTMEERLSSQFATTRFLTALLGAFALLALVLTASGVYGVTACAVRQRTREIGVRMALGAGRSDVLRSVMVEAAGLSVAGIAIGAAAALALGRLLGGFLYGVTPTDPVTLVGVSLLIAGVAMAASFVPARAATKVDPVVALRWE